MRELVIDRLIGSGFQRPAGTTVEAHRAELERIAAKLAYLDRADLATLAEGLMTMGEGKAGDRWPREVRVVKFARTISAPPPGFDRKVTSFMACAVGRRAQAEGWAGPLLSALVKPGPPPTSEYALAQLREQAAEERRRLVIIEERLAAGQALSEDDARFRGFWDRREKMAAQLVRGEDMSGEQ
ncbi:hypothetical protein FDP22_16635 [Paroceanicella profunda]|uniref:Uncharacterized protein n=1 Tax=Paroceanicella profunda TaxID=2579971 RepID=A0A5B8FWL2_9RHOB|nr:hypothetical protein [Paroceanicella profunda]QDL93266.1 hypothetical protein FDP22_16635 [Paroceanicella profunda]